MANDKVEFDINSILDGTLDDLADMPEFKPFPVGTHRILGTLIDKTAKKDHIGGHPAYEFKMVAEETMELADASKDEPLIKGAETNVLFMLDNEMGQGQFKALLSAVAVKFGPAPNRELAGMVKNLEMLVVTKQRQNKEKTQTYTGIVESTVV